MIYSITFNEKDYTALTDHLFNKTTKEQAAYLLCRPSVTEIETRLIVREIIPVLENELIESSEKHMKITSLSFRQAMKKANETKQCFLFVHSHPASVPYHSKQDNDEELKLFKTAYNRIHSNGPHGSIVFSAPDKPRGRFYFQDQSICNVSMIRSIGTKFIFYYNPDDSESIPQFFDRQIRAFGKDIQKLLKKLTIGIVGVGGTGSAVSEQLIRLGVGKIIISDEQTFEISNVNRVYGSRVSDDGQKKINLIKRLADDIGLGTEIILLDKNITYESRAKRLRDCDIIFGCTDDEWGRSILCRLVVYYLIPVFDMGVKINSLNGTIKSVEGRVTTLLPYEACLLCRDRINSTNIYNESLEALKPKEAQLLRKEGYIPTLGDPAPAVIFFTTSIASLSISEFIHRLTGYLGIDRVSTEIIYQFHNTKLRTNRSPSNPDCFCSDSYNIGRADATPFLDITWRPE